MALKCRPAPIPLASSSFLLCHPAVLTAGEEAGQWFKAAAHSDLGTL